MTQECFDSLATADVNNRLPKGIHVTKTDDASDLGIERTHCREEELPWGYLYLHNMTVPVFERQMNAYNATHPDAPHACFVHRSYSYKQKTERGGVKKELKPTVSGLVFLQGTTSDLQAFLRLYYPQYHLVKDHSRNAPASITNAVMQPFMTVLRNNPERVTFLRDPF